MGLEIQVQGLSGVLKNILRFRELVTRWAHNPKICGSIPQAATRMSKSIEEKKRCDAIGRQKRVAKQRKEILAILGDKCIECDFDNGKALAIDHKFGGGTKERNSVGGGYYSYVLKKN